MRAHCATLSTFFVWRMRDQSARPLNPLTTIAAASPATPSLPPGGGHRQSPVESRGRWQGGDASTPEGHHGGASGAANFRCCASGSSPVEVAAAAARPVQISASDPLGHDAEAVLASDAKPCGVACQSTPSIAGLDQLSPGHSPPEVMRGQMVLSIGSPLSPMVRSVERSAES